MYTSLGSLTLLTSANISTMHDTIIIKIYYVDALRDMYAALEMQLLLIWLLTSQLTVALSKINSWNYQKKWS